MSGPGEQFVEKPEAAPASTLPAPPTISVGTGGPSETGYSPLSLMAIASLGLAIVYALVVAIGGSLSLFYGGPLLLPFWSFLVPILAVVLCLFARYRIKVSEGTLSGRVLTTWALYLSLIFGLGYCANYLATYLAITNQARVRALEWLEALKNNDKDIDKAAEKAFWLTLPPAQRTESREALEIQYNTPGGSNPSAVGPFSSFHDADFVRLMALGGADTHYQYEGVDDWGYEKGGYLVKLRYRVTTPLAAFTLVVGVQGAANRNRDKGGRQWSISLLASHLDKEIDYTPAGLEMLAPGGQAQTSKAFAANIVERVKRFGWPSVYFLTLPPDKVASQVRAAHNLGFLLEMNKNLPFLQGMQSYQQGGLVRDQAPVFWADATQKDAIVAAVKDQFDPAKAHGKLHAIELRAARIPDIRHEASGTRARIDIRMTLDQGSGLAPFVVDARLVLMETKDPRQPWYLEVIELVRARTLPVPPPR